MRKKQMIAFALVFFIAEAGIAGIFMYGDMWHPQDMIPQNSAPNTPVIDDWPGDPCVNRYTGSISCSVFDPDEDEELQYRFDRENDGTWESSWTDMADNNYGGGTSGDFSFFTLWSSEGTYTLAIQVRDDGDDGIFGNGDDGYSSELHRTVNIYNHAPSVSGEGVDPATGPPSTSFTFEATFNDCDRFDYATVKEVHYLPPGGSWQTETMTCPDEGNAGTFNYDYSSSSHTFSQGTVYYYFQFEDHDSHSVRKPSSGTYSFDVEYGEPTVYTNDATAGSSDTLTFNGALDEDGGESCTVDFQYGTSSGSYSADTADQTKSEGNSFSITQGSLNPGERYYFRARAANTGHTAYGTEHSAITAPEALTSFSATASGGNELTLDWTNGAGGDGAYIEYTTGSEPSTWNVGDYAELDVNGYIGGSSYVHGGLTQGTTYYYKAWGYAVDGGIVSDGSGDRPFASSPQTVHEQAIGTAEIQTNTATAVEEVRSTLNAQVIEDGGEACDAWFEWGKTQAVETTTTRQTKNEGDAVDSELTALDPGQIYWYRAGIENTIGVTYGEKKCFLTQPYKPTALTLNTINETTVRLSWITGDGANNTIIERRTNSGEWMRGEGEEIYNGTGTFFEDMNISKGDTYYYQLWSQANWTYNPTIYKESSQNTSDNYTHIYTPQVATGNATNITETGAKIEGRLQDNGGHNCTVWFEYGVDTSCSQSTDEQYTENRVLQPNANGYYGGNYNNVLGFDDTTKWATGGNWDDRDSCAVEDMDLGNTTVDVQGVLRWSKPGVYPNAALYMFLLNGSNTSQKSYHKIYQGQSQVDWTNSTHTWDICPWTGVEWTEEDINSLDIGFYHNWIGGPNTDSFASQAHITVVAEENSLETNFSQNIYGLNPGQLYWYQAVAENSNGTARGECKALITHPEYPTGFTATQDGGTIDLSWNKGTGANNTYIEWSYNETWERGEGIFVANTTGEQETAIIPGKGTYYFKAWSQTNWTYNPTEYVWSRGETNTTISIEGPTIENENPSHGATNIDVGLDELSADISNVDVGNLTWEIETQPPIGSAEGTSDDPGTKTCAIAGLAAGTTYNWYVNATNGMIWENKTYTFTTSYEPEVSNASPAGGEIASTQPNCTIDVYDPDGGSVTVSFYEDTTGGWIQQYETTVDATTVTTVVWDKYTQSIMDGESYNWRVEVDDGRGNINVSTYTFTTKQNYVFSDIYPIDESNNIIITLDELQVNITDPDDLLFNWSIETVPNIGNTTWTDASSGMKSCDIAGIQPGTTYTWYINVSGEYITTRENRTFTTAHAPMIYGETPENGSTDTARTPVCNVTIRDEDGGDVTVVIAENSSGSWVDVFEEDITLMTGSDEQEISWNKYAYANTYFETYWWRVTATDEREATNSTIFSFTTYNNAPEISNEIPANNSENENIGLNKVEAQITDSEGHDLSWSIETYPDIGNATGMCAGSATISCSLSGLVENETYLWYVNVSDGYNETNELFYFTASDKPAISNPHPANGTETAAKPLCSVDILDVNTGIVTVDIYENTTGSYTKQYSTTINAETIKEIEWLYENASSLGASYWWKVVATNEKNATNTKIFTFSIDDSPYIVAKNPYNYEGDISLERDIVQATVADPNGESIEWTIETIPDIGNASGTTDNGTINCSISSLQNGTEYTWYVNLSDGDDWTNKTYTFTTSYAPFVYDAQPNETTTDIFIQPDTYILFYEEDQGEVNVTIRTNSSSGWHIVGEYTINTSMYDGVGEVEHTLTEITEYNTTYWWQYNITDGKGNDVGERLQFTTKINEPPHITTAFPTNGSHVDFSTNLITFNIFDREGEAYNYSVETAPYIGEVEETEINRSQHVVVYTPLIEFNTSYTWYVNATDGTSWTREYFTFTTNPNNASETENEMPVNGSTNIPLWRDEIAIDIFDIDGDLVRWKIETSPDVGETPQHNYDNHGRKTCPITNLSAGTTYTWYVNHTDGGYHIVDWFSFTTSYPPTITNEFPTNGSTGEVNIQPLCNCQINDVDNDPENLTVRFYENTSGTWELKQEMDDIASLPAHPSFQYYNADEYNTAYWWKINISDNRGTDIEEIFTFTTKINEAPTLTPTPANKSVNIDLQREYLSVLIQDAENHQVNWSVETSPDIGSATADGESPGLKICAIDGLQADQQYVWYVNVTDAYNKSTQEIYTFNTTQKPVVTDEWPINNSIAPWKPNCSIEVQDPDGGMVSIQFYRWNNSTWEETEYIPYIDVTEQEIIEWNRYESADIRGEDYRWKINITDEKHATTIHTYNFSVNYLISVSDIHPADHAMNVDLNSGQVSITISDRDNQTIDWTIETLPPVGSIGESGGNGTKTCPILFLDTNQTYQWWFNATDGVENITHHFDFATGNIPMIKNETPENGAADVPLQPQCNITVIDPEGDNVTVRFYRWDGSWILEQTNTSIHAVDNITLHWQYDEAHMYNTTFRWKVTAIDEKNASTERIYHFTTVEDALPYIVSQTPADGAENIARAISEIRAEIDDPEGHLMNWTIETSPDIGNASGNNQSAGEINCEIGGIVCGTTYTWYLNISDGYRSIEYDNIFTIAQKPLLSGASPQLGELYVERQPTCNITVTDPLENNINISIEQYKGATWEVMTRYTNLSGSEKHNIIWTYENASEFSTEYFWRVTAENTKGCVNQKIYSFTVRKDWVPPVIHWVNISPEEVQVGMPIEITTKVTDEGGGIDTVSLCLSSLGTNATMVPIGNNTYQYILENLTEEGTYMLYIEAKDEEGNIQNSEFYDFWIIVKILAVRMYTLERVMNGTVNHLLVQITHAKYGTQKSGLADDINISIATPSGETIVENEHPIEQQNGLYVLPFNHSNESGTYTAWTTINYNDSEYIDASSFELRVDEFYEVTGLTNRMDDIFAATSMQSYNSTEEIVAHLRQMGIEVTGLEQETEKFGISGQFLDTAISTIFQWIFMTLFLLGIFIVGSFAYGRRKGSKLAQQAANVPKAVTKSLTD